MQIVDSGPETQDRYTLEIDGYCWGFDADPFHPQGFGQYVGELGKGVSPEWLEEQDSIEIEALPQAARNFVEQKQKECS
jgi:hypothetical protein